MQQRILASVIATLAASKGALADFQVYLGTTNEINNPGTSFSASAMQVHDHSPLGCSDVDGMVSLSNPNDNDASSGGWACDGCNQDAVRDWDIERFEMYNGDDAVGAVTDDPFPLFDRATGAVSTCPPPSRLFLYTLYRYPNRGLEHMLTRRSAHSPQTER